MAVACRLARTAVYLHHSIQRMIDIPHNAVNKSLIPELQLLTRGKVRDVYAIDDDYLLIVATDRLSAYDVVLPDAVPGKGAILTAISNFWFGRLDDIIPNHLTDRVIDDVVGDAAICDDLRARSTVVRRLQPLPIEAVVRGYIAGSGWKDYSSTGALCGIKLPDGLRHAEKFAAPLFTPATKAPQGGHDANISFDDVADLVGAPLAQAVRQVAIEIYEKAAAYALARGIIIADTKFEFGRDPSGALFLIDEALTPDSSRFWPSDGYHIGSHPPSFDKQFVRDYLETLDWDKTAPGPKLPPDIVSRTREKYLFALDRLTENST